MKHFPIITTSELPSQDGGDESIHPNDGLRILARIIAHHLLKKRSPYDKKGDFLLNNGQTPEDSSDESVP